MTYPQVCAHAELMRDSHFETIDSESAVSQVYMRNSGSRPRTFDRLCDRIRGTSETLRRVLSTLPELGRTGLEFDTMNLTQRAPCEVAL